MKQAIFLFCLIFRAIVLTAAQKTVLITGGAGFIGSNFLQYMYEKYPEYHFIVLDALTYAGSVDNISFEIQKSDRFEFIHGNVVNVELVDKIMSRCQYVVHFAAETHVPRSIHADEIFIETDVMGTRSLLAALVQHKNVERFIHISTSEVYGTAELHLPMNEEHPLNPRSPYAAAKAGADRLVYAYGCTFDVPVVTIRPFNNYGPKQHPEKMIPRFITFALQNKPLEIEGSGEQCRDWIHVQDLSAALDRVLHFPDFSQLKNQTINIGSGKTTSVLEIAAAILQAMHLPDHFYRCVPDRRGQVACHIASIDQAQILLGWSPQIDLEEGLHTTIEWYIKNPTYWERKK